MRQLLPLDGRLLQPAHRVQLVTSMDPDPRRFDLAPFTLAELLDALALVMPAGLVDLYRTEAAGWPDAPGMASVTDSMLLILSAVSESHAARVVAHRPDLRERVAAVRADPAGYLESARMHPSDGEG